MVWEQHILSENRENGKVYNFFDYKRRKPFFREPVKITIENPISDTYYMVKNLVYEGKQILALKKEQDPNTIVLVEGKIKDGQLIHISRLSEECVGKISSILGRTI
ncbi:hypothetical protein [Neobacillus citreus]|uniref:Uncharacterized protein n=1 Tax=Neobacillus citreus TaxID=2833578 RepID=A0A942SV07_9BACI|nr:hypothetical protein [Neobacillus citreus]MCH6266828.1 hypothetical protein [Neobacillus citreus]